MKNNIRFVWMFGSIDGWWLMAEITILYCILFAFWIKIEIVLRYFPCSVFHFSFVPGWREQSGEWNKNNIIVWICSRFCGWFHNVKFLLFCFSLSFKHLSIPFIIYNYCYYSSDVQCSSTLFWCLRCAIADVFCWIKSEEVNVQCSTWSVRGGRGHVVLHLTGNIE